MADEKYQTILEGPQIDDALEQMNQRIPEGWAVGTRDGVAVPSTSQFYHNNAKYYAEQAADSVAKLFVAPSRTTDGRAITSALNAGKAVIAVDVLDRDVYLYAGTKDGYHIFENVDTSVGTATVIKTLKCATIGTNWTSASVTQIMKYEDMGVYAKLASPTFIGTPKAPTANKATNNTQIATTAFVHTVTADSANEMQEKIDAISIINTASGSIASFSDGADGIPMRSVKAQIEPVQDLHGYENPWPDGGGKNKLTLSELASNASVTVTEVNNPSYTFVGSGATNVFLRGASSLKLAASTAYILTGGVAQIAIRIREYDSGGTLLATHITSGTSALTFTTDANLSYCDVYVVFYTVPSTATTIQPMLRLSTESDATFAPYSNECPISGWTGAEVTRTGKNLFDPSTCIQNHYIDEDGSIGSSSAFMYSAAIKVKEGTYRFFGHNSASSGSSRARIHGYDASGNWLMQITSEAASGGGNWNISIVVPSGVSYIRISISKALTEGQLELGSATDYEPYAGQTFPVTWQSQAGEVFGGTIDVVSGELKVDRASVDMGTLNWTKSGGANSRFAVNVSNCKTNGIVIADLFQPATYSQVYYHNLDNAIASHNTYSQIAIHSTEYEADYDAAAFKTAMSGHYAVYELAQSVTYQLTPQQITSLLGQNNVWSNTGDTEVTYVADPKLYVDKRITELFAALSQ